MKFQLTFMAIAMSLAITQNYVLANNDDSKLGRLGNFLKKTKTENQRSSSQPKLFANIVMEEHVPDLYQGRDSHPILSSHFDERPHEELNEAEKVLRLTDNKQDSQNNPNIESIDDNAIPEIQTTINTPKQQSTDHNDVLPTIVQLETPVKSCSLDNQNDHSLQEPDIQELNNPKVQSNQVTSEENEVERNRTNLPSSNKHVLDVDSSEESKQTPIVIGMDGKTTESPLEPQTPPNVVPQRVIFNTPEPAADVQPTFESTTTTEIPVDETTEESSPIISEDQILIQHDDRQKSFTDEATLNPDPSSSHSVSSDITIETDQDKDKNIPVIDLDEAKDQILIQHDDRQKSLTDEATLNPDPSSSLSVSSDITIETDPDKDKNSPVRDLDETTTQVPLNHLGETYHIPSSTRPPSEPRLNEPPLSGRFRRKNHRQSNIEQPTTDQPPTIVTPTPDPMNPIIEPSIHVVNESEDSNSLEQDQTHIMGMFEFITIDWWSLIKITLVSIIVCIPKFLNQSDTNLNYETQKDTSNLVEKRNKINQIKEKFGANQDTSLLELEQRIRSAHEWMIQKINHRKRLEPVLMEIDSLKNQLGYNIDKKLSDKREYIKSLKTLRSLCEVNLKYKETINNYRCELLELIRHSIDPRDLTDLMNSMEFKQKSQEIQEDIFAMKVETNFLRELVGSFKRISEIFRNENERVSKELAEQRAKEIKNDKALSDLEDQIDDLNWENNINELRKKVANKITETDKCYKDYLDQFYKCQREYSFFDEEQITQN